MFAGKSIFIRQHQGKFDEILEPESTWHSNQWSARQRIFSATQALRGEEVSRGFYKGRCKHPRLFKGDT
jgi:hypothetical protein